MRPVIPGRALFARTRNPYSLCQRVDSERECRDYGFRACVLRTHPGMTRVYGGRSRAAIQASARYAASIKASMATMVMLPP